MALVDRLVRAQQRRYVLAGASPEGDNLSGGQENTRDRDYYVRWEIQQWDPDRDEIWLVLSYYGFCDAYDAVMGEYSIKQAKQAAQAGALVAYTVARYMDKQLADDVGCGDILEGISEVASSTRLNRHIFEKTGLRLA